MGKPYLVKHQIANYKFQINSNLKNSNGRDAKFCVTNILASMIKSKLKRKLIMGKQKGNGVDQQRDYKTPNREQDFHHNLQLRRAELTVSLHQMRLRGNRDARDQQVVHLTVSPAPGAAQQKEYNIQHILHLMVAMGGTEDYVNSWLPVLLHPNITPYDVSVIREWLEGPPINDLLRNSYPMRIAEALLKVGVTCERLPNMLSLLRIKVNTDMVSPTHPPHATGNMPPPAAATGPLPPVANPTFPFPNLQGYLRIKTQSWIKPTLRTRILQLHNLG